MPDVFEASVSDTVSLDVQPNKTADGYLRAFPRVARTGIQIYGKSEFVGLEAVDSLKDKEIIRVYRPEEEVFSRDAVKTYANRPITFGHPVGQSVDASNWSQFAVGTTGEDVVRDGEHIRVPILLMDGNAISRVEGGVKQISMGYDCELHIVSGTTPSGEAYDAVQRNMRMNHLAIVSEARGGTFPSYRRLSTQEGGRHAR